MDQPDEQYRDELHGAYSPSCSENGARACKGCFELSGLHEFGEIECFRLRWKTNMHPRVRTREWRLLYSTADSAS